jgi:hypothetical protein
VHGADHVRRGIAATGTDVFVAGTASIAVEVAIVLLICQRHRLAPLVAAGGGFGLALGYLMVHFAPAHPWLSDSFTSAATVSPLSWFAATLEVVASLAVGVTGTLELRRRGDAKRGTSAAERGPGKRRGGLASATRPWPAQRRAAQAWRHPLVIAMVAGNAAILVASAFQL